MTVERRLGRARVWSWLVLLPLIVGAALRFSVARSTYGLYHASGDGEEGYYETGIALLCHHTLSQGVPATLPSAFRGPIYPTFIALVEGLFAHPRPGHIRLAQAALFSFEIILVFALGQLLWSPLAGLFGALWVALDPDLILTTASLNIHGFYAFCVLAAAAAAVYWVERRDDKSSVLLGLTLAASLMCRSAHFPLPVLLLAAYLFWWRFPGKPWRVVGLTALATGLFMAPMVIRNALEFHKFIWLDSYKASYIFLRGTVGGYVNTTVDQALDSAEALQPGFRSLRLTGDRLYEALLWLGVKNILHHPFQYAWYCLQRFAHFWSGLWLPVLLALYALYKDPRNRKLQAVFLVAASFSGYSFAGGLDEYRVSALPVLLVPAGCGLAALLEKRGARPALGGRHWSLAAALACVAVLYGGMLSYLALELRAQWWPRFQGVPASQLTRVDDRELEVLRIPAATARTAGVEAQAYGEVLAQRAVMLRKAGDYEAALALLEEALRWSDRVVRVAQAEPTRSASDRAQVYVERARVELQLQREAQAEGDLVKAAEIDPGSSEAVMTLAPLLCRRGRARQALALLLGAQSLLDSSQPAEKARWLAARSLLRAKLGDPAGSRRDLEQALKTDADSACRNAPEVGDRSRAGLDYFDACLARLPGDAKLHLDRGVARYYAGRWTAALDDFREAARLKPDFLEASVSLATALEGRKKYREALETLGRGLQAGERRKDEEIYRQALALRDRLQSGR